MEREQEEAEAEAALDRRDLNGDVESLISGSYTGFMKVHID